MKKKKTWALLINIALEYLHIKACVLWLSLLQNVLFQRVYKARMAAWNFFFFFSRQF